MSLNTSQSDTFAHISKDQHFSDNPRIDRLLQNVVHELRVFTEEQAQQITDLVDIGKAMSAQHDPASILELILSHARKVTTADGGTLYLLSEDQQELAFHVLHNDTLHSRMGGTSGLPITLPSLPLYDADGQPNHANVAAHVALAQTTVNIPDVYEAQGFNFEGTKEFDKLMHYRCMSMLVLPMKNHEDELIGVLQLINAKDDDGNSIPFSPEIVDLSAALASQAAVIMTQQQLIDGLKKLFESFIKAIATAIEEKSKYTGGHIERVAELTMGIAELINNSRQEHFADVYFSLDDLDALRLAAWMHDTGKITTPEYVVDKANKLETIFDRIELIRTRWQAIRLSRQLNAAERKLATVQPDPKTCAAIDADYDAEQQTLNADLVFLEVINMGGEFMSDANLEHLRTIVAQTYHADNADHPFLTEDEVHNLSILKGTLTDHEREVMSGHAVMTRKILERLPWPKKMAQVPEIAAAHHEKLDGTGYPLGLHGEQIQLASRIMAVADIFEALSAQDRPYKKPMPLSQAINILLMMAKDHHLDQDVVTLFLQSDLMHDYARKYLSADQLDVAGI